MNYSEYKIGDVLVCISSKVIERWTGKTAIVLEFENNKSRMYCNWLGEGNSWTEHCTFRRLSKLEKALK